MDELIKAAFTKWLTEQGLLTNGVISDKISEVDIREAFAGGYLSQQADQWVAVENGLPDIGDELNVKVWVTFLNPDAYVATAEWTGERWMWEDVDGEIDFVPHQITAWMPYSEPEPYKEQG